MLGQKTGGRVAGTPNKNRRAYLQEVYGKYPGFNPLLSILELAEKTESEQVKLTCYKELAKYIFPPLQAVSHSCDDFEWSVF